MLIEKISRILKSTRAYVSVVIQSHTFITSAFLLDKELKVSRLMRARLEIIAEILQRAKNGAKKTRIRLRCNLSYHMIQRFLTYLLDIGLLAPVHRSGISYHTTEKGLQFLRIYQNLELLLNTRN